MQFWDYVWSTVIALLVVAFASWAAGAVAVWIVRKVRNRAEWELEKRGGSWVLTRVRRATAFEVTATIGDEANTNVTPNGVSLFYPSKDASFGDASGVNELDGNRSLYLAWIDGHRRSAEVVLEDDKTLYRIRSVKTRRRRLRYTY